MSDIKLFLMVISHLKCSTTSDNNVCGVYYLVWNGEYKRTREVALVGFLSSEWSLTCPTPCNFICVIKYSLPFSYCSVWLPWILKSLSRRNVIGDVDERII